MFLRAVLAWLVILLLAILNGGLRQRVLIPHLGEQLGRVLSPIILATLVFLAAWIFIPWIRPATTRDAWLVGMSWLGLTLAFEFVAGHYLFGDTWNRLLAEYNVAQGRLWVLVPITTLIAPVLAQTFRSPST